MDRLTIVAFTTDMTTMTDAPDHPTAVVPAARPQLDDVIRAMAQRSFCTLATTSPSQRPHVAGVLYAEADGNLYMSTLRSSRKARNLAANPRASICVVVRRLPIGPPATITFPAVGEVLDLDDPEVVDLADTGRINAITSHGELELPDGCILRLRPAGDYITYGIGISLWRLLRDPLNAGGRVSAAIEPMTLAPVPRQGRATRRASR